MTTTATPPPRPEERPGDPRPAFERVAYAWLDAEVDGGQRLDPAALAAEVHVAKRLAAGLLARLRAARARDPEVVATLRSRRARDRITDAYVTRELHGHQQLDPAQLAAEAGVSATVARQWLHALRAQQDHDGELAVLAEPVSHGHPSAAQLAKLHAHFAAGGHQQATLNGRPLDGDQVAAEVERAYWTGEVRRGQRLDARVLARQLGTQPHRVATQLAELRAGPATARERIERAWQTAQQDPGARPPSSSQLARRLGVSDAYVRHVTWQLRTRAQQAPLKQRFEQAHQRLATPPAPADHDQEAGWQARAACRDADPELFFPEPGQLPQTAKAKEVCAGCAVRGPCLQAALHRRDDRWGIYAGTTPGERVALRGRPSMAEGTRFLQDRQAAEQAWALANRQSVDRAARELGVSPQALRRAFDHHQLGQPRAFQGGPARSRAYGDRELAERAWQRAAEVGINQTRKELGVSDRALRTAWHHHGLGLPPRPATRQPPATGRLDPAFATLNPRLAPAHVGPAAERFARVRRAEQEATLGYRVTVELTAENRWRTPHVRAWAVRQRAHHAHQRAREREAERPTPSGRPPGPGAAGTTTRRPTAPAALPAGVPRSAAAPSADPSTSRPWPPRPGPAAVPGISGVHGCPLYLSSSPSYGTHD
jgi:WhiB family redox-sensing transcriptional regulator